MVSRRLEFRPAVVGASLAGSACATARQGLAKFIVPSGLAKPNTLLIRRSCSLVSKRLALGALIVALAGVTSLNGSHAAESSIAARDGAHDFDFDVGVWTTEIVRRVNPMSTSDETIRLTGTVTVRKIWDGRGQLEEIEADGPKGRWEGMTVFLYDPLAHQWSMNFANSREGKFTSPMIGSFENGRGELIGTDTLDGRSILVRAVWSDFTPTTHSYQESYSADGGKSWQVAFTAHKEKKP